MNGIIACTEIGTWLTSGLGQSPNTNRVKSVSHERDYDGSWNDVSEYGVHVAGMPDRSVTNSSRMGTNHFAEIERHHDS